MDLEYDPRIPDQMLSSMEEEARRMGLPVHRIELLGQDRAVVRAFNRAVEADRPHAFLDEVDWDRLDRVREARDRARALSESPQGVPDLPGLLSVI